jgi:hypothetical protein
MSDYLANLAARSLAPERSVQPRLASRFEPVAEAPPLWAEPPPAAPPVFAERVEEGVAARPLPPRAPASRSRRSAPPGAIEPSSEERPAPEPVRRQRARASRPLETPEPPEIRSALEERPHPRPLSHLPPALSPGEGRKAKETPLLQVDSPEFPPSPGGGRVGDGRGAGGEESLRPALQPRLSPPLPRHSRAFATEDREIQDASPRARQAGTVAPAARLEEPPRPAAPPPQTAPPPRPAPPARVVLEPRVTVAPAAPPPALPAPLRAAEAPAPTIQVTIGRIEVRATPPPAQPSRPRPSAPSALSLEEYLRRRSKGGDG